MKEQKSVKDNDEVKFEWFYDFLDWLDGFLQRGIDNFLENFMAACGLGVVIAIIIYFNK